MANFLTVRTKFTIYHVPQFFSDLTGDITLAPLPRSGYANLCAERMCTVEWLAIKPKMLLTSIHVRPKKTIARRLLSRR